MLYIYIYTHTILTVQTENLFHLPLYLLLTIISDYFICSQPLIS